MKCYTVDNSWIMPCHKVSRYRQQEFPVYSIVLQVTVVPALSQSVTLQTARVSRIQHRVTGNSGTCPVTKCHVIDNKSTTYTTSHHVTGNSGTCPVTKCHVIDNKSITYTTSHHVTGNSGTCPVTKCHVIDNKSITYTASCYR